MLIRSMCEVLVLSHYAWGQAVQTGIVRVSDEESPVLIQAVYDTYDIEHVQQDLDVSTLVFIGRCLDKTQLYDTLKDYLRTGENVSFAHIAQSSPSGFKNSKKRTLPLLQTIHL
ncbi:hypothetical protein M8J77_006911 [Diaphorina citri]|nr:hypothetical protein M8J77_006911 [Diaphorina citri]